jgi:hypothetical protein
MPVGSNDDAADTVESLLSYLQFPRVIVVIDDTGGRGTDMTALAGRSPDIVVLPVPPASPGDRGGLWVKIASGMHHVVRHYAFDLLLRFDADAVMLRAGLEEVVAERFADRPERMLGSYRLGPDGGTRDWAPAAAVLRRESGPLGLGIPPFDACSGGWLPRPPEGATCRESTPSGAPMSWPLTWSGSWTAAGGSTFRLLRGAS